nr:immunoglobulin light chain junction region [Macaca mulatta]
CQQYHVFLSF